MGSSREESPDWLRSFQAPTALILSSDSESAHSDDALRKGNERDVAHDKEEKSEEHDKPHVPSHSVWTLSSDSESCPPDSPKREEDMHDEEFVLKKSKLREGAKCKDVLPVDTGKKAASKKAAKLKSPKKLVEVDDHISTEEKTFKSNIEREGTDCKMEDGEEEITEKRTESRAGSSRLPLVLSEKVQRTKALVECDGESIDMSGDMGAVGRIVISDTPSGNHDMFLDMKGTIYKTTILPSRTFCIVSFGQSEAKIEAIMNDFIQLKPQSNVYEAETMVEGTLDGFSFDSEDEGEKMPTTTTFQTDDNKGTEEQTSVKRKKKAPEQTSSKKGKSAGGKPQKKVRKKSQVPKRAKTKK